MFDMIMMLICTTYVISHDFSLVCKESVKVEVLCGQPEQ